MKYGDTLSQQSVPQWEAHNVDYNGIKRVIKDGTSNTIPAAIVIPGQENNVPAIDSFEAELFDLLQEEHQRVLLFVKCKEGEIRRKLGHLRKLALQLQRRSHVGRNRRVPVSRLEKLARLEGEALKAGEDLQALARFIGAQRTAFVKLLKKYKKWSRSPAVALRFERDILNKPKSLDQAELDPLLADLADTLATIRAPLSTDFSQESIRWTPSTSHRKDAAEALFLACKYGTNLDFDMVAATSPLGRKGGHAVYWIHPDNLVQVHILLLQYLRMRSSVAGSIGDAEQQRSTASSTRSSIVGSSDIHLSYDDDWMSYIACDNLKSFVSRRSGTNIQDLETQPGRTLEEAQMGMRFSSGSEAILVACHKENADVDANHGDSEFVGSLKLKRKAICSLVASTRDGSFDLHHFAQTFGLSEDKEALKTANSIRSWLTNRPDLNPLVRIAYKRCRLLGLQNSELHGLWATIDKDISFDRASIDSLKTSELNSSGGESFPHAVLELRWEGRDLPELVSTLNQSHLTERVLGFNMEAHAVSALYRDEGLHAPFWEQTLQKDIRKLPAKETNGKRPINDTITDSSGAHIHSPSTTHTEGHSSAGFSSAAPQESSATSVPEQLENPPLNLFKKKRRKHRYSESKQKLTSTSGYDSPRYWNEFEHGEEAPEDEAYVIYVDPNAPSMFSDLWDSLSAGWAQLNDRAKGIVGIKDIERGEHEALLAYQQEYVPTSAEDSEDDTNVQNTPRKHSNVRRYSTFPTYHEVSDPLQPLSSQMQQARDTLLFRGSIGAFIASYCFLALGVVLEVTRRKKHFLYSAIGGAVGVVASLVFAILALGLLAARERGSTLLGKVEMALVFGTVCIGNTALVVELVERL